MCSGRLKAYGVYSAASCAAGLAGHDLCCNKRSVDGSGKANLVSTKNTESEIWGDILNSGYRLR